MFGEPALIDGHAHRTASITALQACETIVLRRRQFDQLRELHPQVNAFLLASLATQVNRLSEHLLEVLFLPTPSRVHRRLLILADEFGDDPIAITQEDLALMSGTTRSTVNEPPGPRATRHHPDRAGTPRGAGPGGPRPPGQGVSGYPPPSREGLRSRADDGAQREESPGADPLALSGLAGLDLAVPLDVLGIIGFALLGEAARLEGVALDVLGLRLLHKTAVSHGVAFDVRGLLGQASGPSRVALTSSSFDSTLPALSALSSMLRRSGMCLPVLYGVPVGHLVAAACPD